MKTDKTMRTLFSIWIALVIGGRGIAADSQAMPRGGILMRESILTQVLPDDYAEFAKARTSGDRRRSADGAVKLLAATREKLRKARPGPNRDDDMINAHIAAWRLCMQMRSDANDDYTKKRILEEWSKNLLEDNDEIPLQFAAAGLSGVWSRELLTDEFWQLLRGSKKQRSVSAMGWLLYEKGDLRDLPSLEQKRDSGVSIELQSTIQNAINWIKYKHTFNGDRSRNPGPAAAPPRLEIN